MMKVFAPNYTQTPNDLFDHWLPHLGEAELKVLLVVMRKTIGWHKVHDEISASQLAKITGMIEETVVKAAKSLERRGIISRQLVGPNGKQRVVYALIIHENSNISDPPGQTDPPGQNPPDKTDPQKKQNPKKTDIDKSNILSGTLPLSTERGEGDIVPPIRRWKLDEEQAVAFEWLKSEKINTDENILCYWAKTYTIERLIDVVDYARKTCKTNLGGLINSLLYNKTQIPDRVSEQNRSFIKDFIKTNIWKAVTILERYVKIALKSGSDEEIPYNLEPEDFRRKIEKLYAIS